VVKKRERKPKSERLPEVLILKKEDTPTLTAVLARRIQDERAARSWSLQEFALRSGVSRAMISKIERGECSPTAVILSRLSGALGLTMSQLLTDAEGNGSRLRRVDKQQIWVDPETKYRRRSVSPDVGMPLQLVEVELPPLTKISMPAAAYKFLHQQIWVLDGKLRFWEGEDIWDMNPGDCLQLTAPRDCAFENPSKSKVSRYVVALVVRG
jgi:transcriptional regulator with XRE-family HTH domain